MKRHILFSTLLAVVAISANAQRTTRRNLSLIETTTADSITMCPDSLNIAISGYDKPLTSRYETFFVTNHSTKSITELVIELNYTDMNGRQLHSRKISINCDLPSGQTRQLKTRSWDTQFSFYYYLSQKPRRRATPYKTTHRIISASYKHQAQ